MTKQADTSQEDESNLDETTTSTDTRWTYLSSVVTAVVLIGFLLIIGLAASGVLSLSAIGQAWFGLVALVVGMAATWLWGTDTLKAYRNGGQ